MTHKLFHEKIEDPKILIIDLSNNFGGASVRALNILRKMPQGRAALVSLEKSPVTSDAIKNGIKVYKVARNKFDPRIIFNIVKILKKGEYNVLDSQNIQSKLWASFAAWLTKTALVSTLNSYYKIEHKKSLKGCIYQKLEAITQVITDRTIVVSSEIQNHLLNDGVKQEDIVLIPNAVDPDISRTKRDKTWLCTQFNIPLGTDICCSVGRLAEAKAFDFLIRSAAQIQNSGIHFIVVGEGPLRQHLEQLIQQLNLEQQVHLIGYRERNETLKILASSDIFVISSITEGTPLVLLEAAALSVPIIATQVGGIPEMVRNNEQALLIAPTDEHGLSNAIKNLHSNHGLASRLAQNAHSHIIENNNLLLQVEQRDGKMKFSIKTVYEIFPTQNLEF